MDSRDIERLKSVLMLDEANRKINNNFDVISDVTILKDFNISTVTNDSEVYAGSLVHRLLSNRDERPSSEMWSALTGLAKSNDLQSAHAAELYFYLKDKYPIRNDIQPDDAPPNITGDAVTSGFGLMADGEGGDEDCD